MSKVKKTKKKNNTSQKTSATNAEPQTQPEISNHLFRKLLKQVERNEKGDWVRFYLSIGFAIIFGALGIAFTEPSFMTLFQKIGLVTAMLIFGLAVIFRAAIYYDPQSINRKNAVRSVILLGVGASIIMVGGTVFPFIGWPIFWPLIAGLAILLAGLVFTTRVISKGFKDL